LKFHLEKKGDRKLGQTRILTDTPEKEAIEAEYNSIEKNLPEKKSFIDIKYKQGNRKEVCTLDSAGKNETMPLVITAICYFRHLVLEKSGFVASNA